MTIIMGYTIGIVPIVMGDILVTRTGALPSEFNKLAFGRMEDEAAAHVCMLRQKVNIINDNMIIAWAGSLLQARAALSHIADEIEHRPDAASDITAVIHAIPEEERDDLSLIGLFRRRDKTSFFWHGVKCVSVEVLTNAVIAGSGTDFVVKLVAELEHAYRTRLPDNDDGMLRDQDKAISYAMWIAAEAAGLEHASGENLIDRWGGAIEVASFEMGRAKKLSDALYVFWDFHTEGGGRLELVSKFVKVQYHEDLLVIFLLSGQGPSLEEMTFEVEVWGIPPLLSPYRIGSVVQVPRPTFGYDHLCSQIVIKTGTTAQKVVTRVLRRKDDHSIRFWQHGRKTAVEIDDDYKSAIETQARETSAEVATTAVRDCK